MIPSINILKRGMCGEEYVLLHTFLFVRVYFTCEEGNPSQVIIL